MMRIAWTLATAAATLLAATAHAQPIGAQADMTNPNGDSVGTVTFEENGNGVLIRAELSGMPPGWHAFHLHETGSCEDGFAGAGGHYNPAGLGHGVLNPSGAHAGDLPNIWISDNGRAGHHVITSAVTLAADAANSLMDADGSAVIVHENPDSYGADAGAGGRIACGVIVAR